MGTEVNSVERLSPLVKLAIISGAQGALRLQILRGANVNAIDDRGRTPLMLAAARGDQAVCLILLDAGALTNSCDQTGIDAIGHARAGGHHKVVELLSAASSRSLIALSDQPSSMLAIVEALDGDSGDWLVEDEPAIPAKESIEADIAAEIQRNIAIHQPIDEYARWDDVEIELPEEMRRLQRRRIALTGSDLEQVRRTFQEGLETGRVRLDPLVEAIYGTDEVSAQEIRNRLAVICGDLGMVLEESNSYSLTHAISHPLSEEADAIIDEAIANFETHGAGYSDPLFQFVRAMGRYPLLTRDDEQQIGREVEQALAIALKAFARLPFAIDSLIDIAENVALGVQSLASVTDVDPAPAAELIQRAESELEPESFSEKPVDEISPEDRTTQTVSTFVALAKELRVLSKAALHSDQITDRMSEILSAMRIRWSVLTGIAKLVGLDHSQTEESVALSKALRNVRLVRERLFHANLRLVFAISRKYMHRALPLSDLVQEGCIGLMKAVERFDYRRGFKFSTYATWWVKQGITRSLADQERLVRFPVHVVESINALDRAVRELEDENNREPDITELASRLGLSVDRIEKLRRMQYTVVDIDAPDDDGGSEALDPDDPDDDIAKTTISDSISETASGPADRIEQVSLQLAVRKLLQSIDDRGMQVISLRFGMDNDQDMTLEQVGQILGVTRERIRQIEAKAFRRLRHKSRRNHVDGYGPDWDTESYQSSSVSDEADAVDLKEFTYPAESGNSVIPIARRRPPRPSAYISPPENWAEEALQLAKSYGLRAFDFRESGKGIFVELASARSRDRQYVRKHLKWLGFEQLPGYGLRRK